ncbi:MAG: histone deacetylase family protein [Planctomycetes bacterium]|nr:histone deacetylase family protein [Planctomycetota bacterium]MCP4770364.1 histone deacetylase family protein [Planctomycetota bacterium]MCP4860544.1 histone deacetylase family protein [Planctomycetota bacterium]
MISIFTEQHVQHDPAHEIFRGERVPCFEAVVRGNIVRNALIAHGHELRPPSVDAEPLLARVHDPRYLSFLEGAWQEWLALDQANATEQPFPSVWPIRTLRADVEPADFIAKLGFYSMDNGTPLAAGTWRAVRAAADAAVTAASLVVAGERAAFCATRPPGHHAGRDFMGGYCFLNYAAIAATTLQDGGAARVAILDVDYHHGNGTQSLFEDRKDIFTLSLHADPRHEFPFYLGHADETGIGAGVGANANFPLAPDTDVATWFGALDQAAARIAAFAPDALVVPLGLDTFVGDPLSSFQLTGDDFLRLGARLQALNLPTVFVLEGGYAVTELGENAARVLDGFEGA